MADTKDFDVVRACRSDGADTGPGYWPVTPAANAAKKAVTEKAPRAKPQMTRLSEDDPRYVEWRVKLGILLKQELSPNPDEGNPWYVQFPRGYWLYERSKHLWVSGYPIKAKLFKTPQEFALHLIWLLSSSKDYKDCCCVHCNLPSLPKLSSSGDDTPVMRASASPVKPEKVPPKITPVPLPQIPGQPPSKPSVPTQRAQGSQRTGSSASPVPPPAATAKQTPVLAPSPGQGQRAQPHTQAQLQTLPQSQPQTQPQAQPQAQSQHAVTWSLKSPLLFRVGEQVWYKNGAMWRLGVIAASSNTQNASEIIPLGHGMVQQANAVKHTEEMRPFHAFSVPPVTIADLKDKVYDEIPWESMFRATGNDSTSNQRDLLALDASKMAASKIDYSHSLWSPFPEDGSGKTAYFGCFLGSERVEIGDCLRLMKLPPELGIASNTAILGLRTLFTSKDYPGAVLFCGHIYMLVKGDPSTAAPAETLPLALRDEAQWRQSISNGAPTWQWVLVKENVVLQEQNIRGRFYPTHRLSPILDPGRFQQAVQQGNVDDQVAQLNNRMDGMGKYLGRKLNRVDTLGTSVPHAIQLALEPHIREDQHGMSSQHS